MALYDALFEFSDDQDISQTVGSVAATNVLDWGNNDLEMGAGQPLYLNVRIGTAFAEVADATNGSSTLVVALVSDEDATIDGSSRVIYQTMALTETSLTDGAWVLRMSLPVGVDEDHTDDGGNDGRYLGLYYTIGGATSAVGTIDAWIDHGPQSSTGRQVDSSNI
jgi:hypothetical protein